MSENKELKNTKDQLKAKIQRSKTASYMAQQQGHVDLVEKALGHKSISSKLLSELKAEDLRDIPDGQTPFILLGMAMFCGCLKKELDQSQPNK